MCTTTVLNRTRSGEDFGHTNGIEVLSPKGWGVVKVKIHISRLFLKGVSPKERQNWDGWWEVVCASLQP